MAEPRINHTATPLPDGSVLVAGGESVRGQVVTTVASAERFDPTTGRFTALRPMVAARETHAAVRLQDGRVLLVGGFDVAAGTALASAELFDPATGRFARVGAMAISRDRPTATLLSDGSVLVAGGFASDLALDPLATAELFDPATMRFEPTGGMTEARGGHATALLSDGRVAVIGGRGSRQLPLRGIEIYDPNTGAFTRGGELVGARSFPSATRLASGKILVAGGLFRPDINSVAAPLTSVEVYDPATQQSAVTGVLATPRVDHQAIGLLDGRVLLAGGWSRTDPLVATVTADLMDPEGSSIRLTEPMATARARAAAVLLLDGRVLVTGGISRQEGELLATAEVYEP